MGPEFSIPPLIPAISRNNTVHALPTCSLKCILTLSSYLRLYSASDLFPSCFPTKTLFAFPAMCPSQMKIPRFCYDKMLISV
jgi:hypothetical protein